MAAVIFFGAVSCAKEDISSSLAGGEVEVTFTANLPELGTRAYGDGLNATLLRYYVYDANGAELEQLRGVATTTNRTFSFTLPLIKGMTYDFVLWADKNVGDVDNPQGFYQFDGKIATINYNGEANNNDRDAFCGFVDGFDPVRHDPHFELHRPFAQLNAATSDKALVAKSGVELTTSTITVKAYDKFDVTTGDIAADAQLIDVAFTAATMPCNLNPVEILKNGYDYLSMNYLLVPEGGMNVNVAFTFNGTKGIVFKETEYTNVPLKQNFRTNILGALLTKQTEIEVEILPGFGDPDQDYVMTAADLKEQIENAPAGEQTEIVLGGDIDLNDLLAGLLETRATTSAGLIIPEGKEIILNLGGYTLSQTKECTAHYAMISNNGTLTVVNGTVSFDDTGAGDPNFGWGSYTIENRGNLVIEEGAVVEHLCDLNTVEKNIHMYCAVQQASGTTTVNGGVISTPTYRSLRVNGGTATFNGGVFEGQVWMHPFTDSTALTINGGEFAPRGGDGSSVYVENSSKAVGLTVNGGYFATKIGSSNVIENAIHGGLFGVDPSGFKAKVATDRIVVKTGDVWGVFEALTAADEEAFVAAVANGGQITLEQNITLTKTLVVEKPTVILMNGKTISANIHKNVGAVIKNTSVLTLENGTISSLAENGGSALVNNGTANVNGVTLNGAINANGSWPSYTVNNTGVLVLNNSTITSYHGAVSSYNDGALVTLNNTNIDMTGITGFTSHGIYTYNNGAAVVNSGNIANNATDQNSTGASVINGAITVNGGNFTGRIESYYGTPVLKGGTFSVKPNKNYIPEGYEVVEENGKYTIIGVVKTAEALAEALVAGGKITLGADIELSAEVVEGTSAALAVAGQDIIIDLNGKTLKAGKSDKQRLLYIGTGANVTIENGKLEIISTNGMVDGTNASTGGSSVIYCNGGNISMSDVEIIGSQRGGHRAIEVHNGVGAFNNIKIDVNYGLGINAGAGANVTIDDCNITVTGMYSAPYNSTCFSVMGGGEMVVNSGNYKLINNNTYSTGDTHGGWVGIIMSSGGSLTLNGGTFTNIPAQGFMPQYERPLFSCDATAGNTATLNFMGGTYAPQEDQIAHKGGSGGTEIVKIKGETIPGYSVNTTLLEKMTNNGNGTWTVQ